MMSPRLRDGVHKHVERVRLWTKLKAEKISRFAPQLKQPDLSNVPDWVRRSIRLSLCLMLFGLLSHAINYPDGLAKELQKSFNWAAITCTVVTAPLIGKVSEVSTYRIIGTVSGGLWGFLMFMVGTHTLTTMEDGSGVFVALMSPVVVISTTYFAYKRGLDQLARFIQLTYILVGYGSYPNAQEAILLALVRISGIVAGGVVSLIFAVLILPRAANIEACREAKRALKMLIELNHEVWRDTSTPVPVDLRKKKKSAGRHGNLASLSAASNVFSTFNPGASNLHNSGMWSSQHGAEKSREGAERLYASIYLTLQKVEEMMEQCKGEVYVHHLNGQYFFLPGLHFFQAGRWRLPREDMKVLVAAIRRIVRLQWTLLLSFEQGFDENMTDVLKSFYPKALMSELSLYMHRSLVDLHAAFPSAVYINIDNLMTLGQVVDCLIQISDTRNREAALNMRLGFRRSGGSRRNKDGSQSKSRNYADNNIGSVGGKEVPTAFLSQMEAGIAAISLDPAGVVPINEGLPAGGESLSQSTSVTAVPAGLFVTQALSTIPGQPSVILLPPRQFLRCSIDGAGRSPLESDSIGKEVPEQGSQSAAAFKEGLVTTRKSLDVGSGSGRNVTWEDGGLGGNGESAMTKDSAVASLQLSHSRTSYLQPSVMSSAYSNGCEDQPSSRDQSIGRRNALMLPTIMSEENLASFHQGSGMASFASRAGDSVASEQDGACRAVQVNSSQVLDPSSLGNSAVAHGLSDCITPGTASNGSPQYLVHSAEGGGGTGGGSGLASTAAAAQVLDPASLGCDQFQSWSRPGGSASPAGVGGEGLNTFGEEEGGEEDTLEMFSRSLGGTAGTLRSLLQKNGSHSQAHRGMLSIAAMAMESARSSYSGESGLESPGGVDVRRGRSSTEISTTDLMYRPDQVTSPGSGGPLTRAGSGHSIPIYPITSIAEQHTVTTFAAHQEFDANLCMTSNIASSTADLGLHEGMLMRSMGDSGNVGADPLFESLMQEATKKLGRDSHTGFSSAVASRRSSDYGSSDPLLMANGVSLHHHITPRDCSGGGSNVNIREQPNAVSAGGASADTHGSAAPPRHSEAGPAWQPPHGRGDSVAVSSTASADIQQLSGTVALHISGQDFASLQDQSPFAPFASNLSPSSSVDEAHHAIQMPVLTSTMSVQPQLSGKKEGSSRSRLGREDLQHTAQQASDTPTTADALKVDEGERTSLLPGSGEAGKTSSSDVLGNAAGQLSGFAGFISKARRSLLRVNSDEFKSSSVFANVTAVVPPGLGTPSQVPLGSALSYGDSSIKRISLSRAATATAAGGVLLDGMPVIPLADAEALDTVRQRMESHLDSRLSSAFVEPICFPPTEEGYVSQVHWYSFQFAMDEMVDELEDAFLAVSAVLEKLPHPIR